MKAILTVFMALLLAACAGEDSQRPYVSSGPSNLPSSASTAALGQGTTTLQPSLLPGEIAGDLIYPGGKHPEMLIYAIRTDTEKPSAFVDHMWARDEAMPIPEPFGITVVPGTYHVVAYTVAGSTGPHIGAMGAVRCSGEPVCQPNWVMTAVTVRASELVNHVEIKEWNPPREAVPPEPRLDQYATFPPAAWPTTDLPAFRNPADAAVFGMGRSEYRSAAGRCPVLSPDLPAACLSFEKIQVGKNAAYIRGQFGAPAQSFTIWLYVFQDAAGWHFVNQVTEPPTGEGAPPRIGQSDTVQTTYQGGACADAHAAPGRQQPRMGCLRNGTAVSIDGGPTYTEEAGPNGVHAGSIWWHVAGKGWIRHEFLIPQLTGD